MAVTEAGTVCKSSARFVAVTTTSSRTTPFEVGRLVESGLCWAIAVPVARRAGTTELTVQGALLRPEVFSFTCVFSARPDWCGFQEGRAQRQNPQRRTDQSADAATPSSVLFVSALLEGDEGCRHQSQPRFRASASRGALLEVPSNQHLIIVRQQLAALFSGLPHTEGVVANLVVVSDACSNVPFPTLVSHVVEDLFEDSNAPLIHRGDHVANRWRGACPVPHGAVPFRVVLASR